MGEKVTTRAQATSGKALTAEQRRIMFGPEPKPFLVKEAWGRAEISQGHLRPVGVQPSGGGWWRQEYENPFTGARTYGVISDPANPKFGHGEAV
jgi:hypothetical protein